jgi:serine/threonine protein kinase
VALKIYQKEKIKDLQRKKSIRREIKIMKRINHPNIVKLYDVIETDTQVVLVMEMICGGSTHGYLKSKPNRRMEEINAKKIIGQLLSALSYLHSKCISHRDIKLENVMLD